MATENNSHKPRPVVKVENVRKEFIIRRTHTPVSYTHLTLPTSDLV